MLEQLELPLFDPPSFQQLLASRGLTTLTVELNKRMRRSWHVIVDRMRGVRRLQVPALLAAAPAPVKHALIDWAMLYDTRGAMRRNRRGTKSALEHVVWHYMEQHHPESRRTHRKVPAQVQLNTTGCRYDLLEVFDHVNQTCFDGKLQTLVRWGSFASLTSYHSTIVGPDGTRHNLVTIAGAYDHPDVPRFAIEAVMHHELLHIAVPPTVRNGRRVVHGREFRSAEKAHEHFQKWNVWQRTEVARCAVSLRRRRKRGPRKA